MKKHYVVTAGRLVHALLSLCILTGLEDLLSSFSAPDGCLSGRLARGILCSRLHLNSGAFLAWKISRGRHEGCKFVQRPILVSADSSLRSLLLLVTTRCGVCRRLGTVHILFPRSVVYRVLPQVVSCTCTSKNLDIRGQAPRTLSPRQLRTNFFRRLRHSTFPKDCDE